MRFKKGDIVRFREGKIDWEVHYGCHPFPDSTVYLLVSGMSGNRRTAFEHELKPWTPDA